MDSRSTNLQETLNALSLEPVASEGAKLTDKVLVGKVLSLKAFKRFTVVDIIKRS